MGSEDSRSLDTLKGTNVRTRYIRRHDTLKDTLFSSATSTRTRCVWRYPGRRRRGRRRHRGRRRRHQPVYITLKEMKSQVSL